MDAPFPFHRRSIRLKGYDYSQAGAYFVTLVTQDRQNLFGTIDSGLVRLSIAGRIVSDAWLWMEQQYPYACLGEFCVMPNHIHGILTIVDLEAGTAQKTKTLGSLIGAYKTVTTRQVRANPGYATKTIWQRNYYEHIIRSQADYERIGIYIQQNPVR